MGWGEWGGGGRVWGRVGYGVRGVGEGEEGAMRQAYS